MAEIRRFVRVMPPMSRPAANPPLVGSTGHKSGSLAAKSDGCTTGTTQKCLQTASFIPAVVRSPALAREREIRRLVRRGVRSLDDGRSRARRLGAAPQSLRVAHGCDGAERGGRAVRDRRSRSARARADSERHAESASVRSPRSRERLLGASRDRARVARRDARAHRPLLRPPLRRGRRRARSRCCFGARSLDAVLEGDRRPRARDARATAQLSAEAQRQARALGCASPRSRRRAGGARGGARRRAGRSRARLQAATARSARRSSRCASAGSDGRTSSRRSRGRQSAQPRRVETPTTRRRRLGAPRRAGGTAYPRGGRRGRSSSTPSRTTCRAGRRAGCPSGSA